MAALALTGAALLISAGPADAQALASTSQGKSESIDRARPPSLLLRDEWWAVEDEPQPRLSRPQPVAPPALRDKDEISHVWTGMIVGALAGGAIGVLIGYSAENIVNDGNTSAGEVTLIGGLVGLGIGAGLGAFVGWLIERE
ncbi:MAG: hypothetical protein ABFS46_17010 [Myxococcota bacterium]